MAISYLLCGIYQTKTIFIPYSLPLVFAASIAPDLDFLASGIFGHHTLTHSIMFWLVIYTPFFVWKKKSMIPYFTATMSHFLISDVFTGNPPIFYGISDQGFGIVYPTLQQEKLSSSEILLYRAFVEMIAVGIFSIVATIKKDVFPLLSGVYPYFHVMLLGMIIFLVFIGATKSEIIFLIADQNQTKYIAYSVILIAQLLFFILVFKGSTKIGQRPFPK